MPFVDGAEQEPHHLVVVRLTRQHFCGMRGLLSLFVPPPAFVDLGDVQVGIAVAGVSMQLRTQDLDGVIGLLVFPEQQRIARANSRIRRVLRQGFLARL